MCFERKCDETIVSRVRSNKLFVRFTGLEFVRPSRRHANQRSFALRCLLCVQSLVHRHRRRHRQHDATSLLRRLVVSVNIREVRFFYVCKIAAAAVKRKSRFFVVLFCSSSLETMPETATQSSSFESLHALNGPSISPLPECAPFVSALDIESTAATSVESAESISRSSQIAAREAFAQSSSVQTCSSGYGSIVSHTSASLDSLADTQRGGVGGGGGGGGSAFSRSSNLVAPPTPIAARSAAITAVTAASAAAVTIARPQTLGVDDEAAAAAAAASRARSPRHQPPPPSLLVAAALTGASPLLLRPTPQRLMFSATAAGAAISRSSAAGYVFTKADRTMFAQAAVQFCARDLHNPDVVQASKRSISGNRTHPKSKISGRRLQKPHRNGSFHRPPFTRRHANLEQFRSGSQSHSERRLFARGEARRLLTSGRPHTRAKIIAEAPFLPPIF